jgi:hypothetical protein
VPSEGETLPPQPLPETSPGCASVPGYEVIRELGRGGMGVVYLARQRKLNRLVALKMILAGGHAGAADLARFQTEAEAIARLRHANIVQVYEVGDHEGKPFFSLEFCGGGSLEKKLGGTPLPAREAAALVETLARAMQAAHEQHVIHRDLKPANVLLTEDGTPKITDFGLAKKLDEAGQTATGAVMGTPSYMAPEQAGGKSKEIGPAADVYALGAILYECLTGRPPFKAATALDTLMQVLSDEPVPLRQLQSRTPRDLETMCLKCLCKEPAKRYESAAALADDLGRWLKGMPVQARPPRAPERLWRWCKRKPWVAGLGATVALLFFLVLVVGPGAYLTTLLALRNEAKQRRDAERQLAENYLDRGLAMCQEGEVPAGLLWLGRSLRQAPADAEELQRLIRLNLSAWRPHVTQLRSVVDCQQHGDSTALSPDGTKFATWANENDMRLWDVATENPIGNPLRHAEEVQHAGFSPHNRFLAFSPNGGVLLAGSLYGISRWDTTTGKRIGAPISPDEGRFGLVGSTNACAAAFSPDGKTILAVTGLGSYFARRWDAATGEPMGTSVSLGEPKEKNWRVELRNGFAISPDLKTVVMYLVSASNHHLSRPSSGGRTTSSAAGGATEPAKYKKPACPAGL